MKLPYCENCKTTGHYATFCFAKKKKVPAKQGKQAIKWASERKIWIAKNPSQFDGLWYCHYCSAPLVATRQDFRYIEGNAQLLTIDHIKPRSSFPKGRYDMKNLVACCIRDNTLKGSMSYENFCAKYYPHLLAIMDLGV